MNVSAVTDDEHERGDPNRTVSAAERGRASQEVRRRRWYLAAIFAIVVVATVVRAATLTAGLPYTSYRDEGHVLIPAERLVARTTWDPGVYQYPTLVIEAAAVSVRVFDFVRGSDESKAGARESRNAGYYDIVEPKTLIVAGRVLVLLASVGTVLFAMLLATRLRGRRAGIVAGVITALLPALVTRASIVIVDTPAAFFAMATLLLAARLPDARYPMRASIAAGVAAGLALSSKYQAGLFLLVVLIVVASRSTAISHSRDEQCWL